jgi:aminobutyraldehyde dehydrogenase
MGLTAWKIAPALAAGNTVVLKPTEVAPLTTLLLGELVNAILPKGVLNIVTGTGGATGTELVRHKDVSMVSLTGGTATGRAVMREAAATVKKVHLELGGKAPVLVFEDADLALLARTLKSASFNNSGQDCTAASRIYVARSLYTEALQMLAEVASSIRVGNGYLDSDVEMGPVVSAKHLHHVAGFVERAKATSHARVIAGGKSHDPGFFYLPTIVADVEQHDEIVQEEIFGPVVAITTFEGEEDAIRKANDINYGLAASVWSKDVSRALSVAARVQAGTVWINDHGPTMSEMPFGGYKQSGIGRDLSIHSLEAHTQLKHIAVTHRVLI